MSEEQASVAAENRPKLWRYYRERNLSVVTVARAFGRSREWVRKVTLPFDDPKRVTPSVKDVERGFVWSAGELRPEDWYPPRLSPPANVSDAPEGVAS